MTVANFSEFRSALKEYLDNVEENNETVIVKRSTGKGSVIISLSEYNSLMETLHLIKSGKNAERLLESIKQIKSGDTVQKDLLE